MIKSNSYIDNSSFNFKNTLQNDVEKSRNVINLNDNCSIQKIQVNKKLFSKKNQTSKKKTLETNTTNPSTSRERTPIKISSSPFLITPNNSCQKIKQNFCFFTPKRKNSSNQNSNIKKSNENEREFKIIPSIKLFYETNKGKNIYNMYNKNIKKSVYKIHDFEIKKKNYELNDSFPNQSIKKSKSSSNDKRYINKDIINICKKIKKIDEKIKRKEDNCLLPTEEYFDNKKYLIENKNNNNNNLFNNKNNSPIENSKAFDKNSLMKLSLNITNKNNNFKGISKEKKSFSNISSINDKINTVKPVNDNNTKYHYNSNLYLKNPKSQKSFVNLIKKPIENKKIKINSIEKTNIENNKIQTKQVKIIRNSTEIKKLNNNIFYFPNKLNINNNINKSVQINLYKNLNLNNIDNFIIGKELGKGSFATVKLGIHKITNKKYAIKIYSKTNLYDIEKRNSVKNEISILKQLNHENIMKLYEVIDTKKYIYLILEYINGISLMEYLKNKPQKRIEENKCKEIFYQIVKGINYCQMKNIYHRDIKLENILLIDEKIVKIIDFGFSVKCSIHCYQKFLCGTPNYMSPEIINKNKYIPKYSDLWSLGVLLYIMLIGSFPFKAKTEEFLIKKINKCEYELPNFISINAKNLIKKILLLEPKNRLSTEDILLDSWFEI